MSLILNVLFRRYTTKQLNMSKKTIIWMLPLVLLFISWSNNGEDTLNTTDELTVTNQLISLVNEHRINLGKPAFIRNATADNLAAQHANYMISNKNVNSDNFEVRWETLSEKENAQDISENVGVDLSAKEAMNAYMSRVWLKANVEGDFTHTGIAVKKDAEGRYYYTQIFFK